MSNHECATCGHFTAYYEKAYCCYLRTDCGNCGILKNIVKKHSTCEKWRAKTYNSKVKKGIILNEMNNVVTNINIIKDFIEGK